ncbi:hypothetical protein BRC65_03955 [Halobacteriales archaeon QH_2_65_14]|nr:MAG: hypothetical protein BRC65_03955 [Halobacteriales archaeon QH_2_65_14]
MSRTQPDDGHADQRFPPSVSIEEFRRRNLSAVAIDVLYLFTTAFFATLFVRGFWPAVIAGISMATLLYFAWRSSWAFFLAQLVAIVLAVVATVAGVLPL